VSTNDAEGLRKRKRPFVQVDRITVRDTHISFRALGVLTWILDRPEGWRFKADNMATLGRHDGPLDAKGKKTYLSADRGPYEREGRDAIRVALRELGAAGYYRLERRRMLDGTMSMGAAISEDPVEAWADQWKLFGTRGVPVVQQADGTFLVRYPDGSLLPDDFPPPEDLGEFSQVKPETGFQSPAPGTENPAPGKPGPGQPATGGPVPYKKEGVGKRGKGDNPPPTPQQGKSGTSRPDRAEAQGGEDSDLSKNTKPDRGVAIAVLDAVLHLGKPDPLRMPGNLARGQLAKLLVGPLSRGWEPADLATVLGAPLGGADDVVAVLRYRIGNLADAPPAPVPSQPEGGHDGNGRCGDCNPNRMVEAVELDPTAEWGVWEKCPKCHPDLVSA
jgi:hypothetical protein